MGRLANALDWTEGSGLLRALVDSDIPGRLDSEIRMREHAPVAELSLEEEEPTGRFERSSVAPSSAESGGSSYGYAESESLAACSARSARGVARLSALADWIDGEATSGIVVSLVRAFLDDLENVNGALGALLGAASTSRALRPAGLDAAVQSLAYAVGLWRMKLIEHVDDLALNDHRSLSGWSSLPEYSAAYTLAFLKPALAGAEVCAHVAFEETSDASGANDGSEIASLIGAVGVGVRRLNATLRDAIEAETSARSPVFGPPAVTTW